MLIWQRNVKNILKYRFILYNIVEKGLWGNYEK